MIAGYGSFLRFHIGKTKRFGSNPAGSFTITWTAGSGASRSFPWVPANEPPLSEPVTAARRWHRCDAVGVWVKLEAPSCFGQHCGRRLVKVLRVILSTSLVKSIAITSWCEALAVPESSQTLLDPTPYSLTQKFVTSRRMAYSNDGKIAAAGNPEDGRTFE